MISLKGLRSSIPAGTGLADDVWKVRHRAILVLAWLHVVGVPLYGIRQGDTVAHSLFEGAPIALFALLATLPQLPRRARAAAASAALLTSSAILVHFSHGLIEMHFHFFVMVPICALYQDWVPFLIAIGYVLVHHGLVGQLSPESVFNHHWGQARPWTWAAVHALFIAGLSAVCLATWGLNERLHARQLAVEGELLDEKRVVETLHSIGTGVVSELDLQRVSQLVTDEAVGATGAAFGAFFYNVYDSEGESYMLYTLSGAPRSAFASFPMPRNTKIFAPTFSGAGPVRIDDVTIDERYGQNAPYNGMPPGHLAVRSYLAVPVHSRGSSEVLGGLFFGHPEPARFSERDERIAVGIATQAAIAFDNARLYQAERDAHDAAEDARARVSLLAEAGQLLVASLDPTTTLTNVAEISVPTLGDICVIDVVANGRIDRVAAFGTNNMTEFVEGLRANPPDPSNDAHPVVRVLRGGDPELIDEPTPGLVDRATRSPEHSKIVRKMHGTTAIVVPLLGHGVVLGAISFITVSSTERRLTHDDLPLAEELGRRAGMALENATLYQAERDANVAAEKARTRLAMLSDAGRLVVATLDEKVALRNLAQITVPTFADACLIDILEENGAVRRVTAAAPGLEGPIAVLADYAPDPQNGSHPTVKAMRGEGSALLENITPDVLDVVTPDPRQREATTEFGAASAIIVPLLGRERIYGSLSLITSKSSGRRFGPDDVPLAEEIGRRAGIAIENSRLYDQQRNVAESLQHALLPQELPAIPGFEATARYLPGSPGERVGGDWYDLFAVPNGEIAIVIGDVVGHGIPAASLMAQLRNAMRAYIWNGMAPAEVLGKLNQLLYGLEREGMATASVGLLDPITSRLRFANAGHPPFLHMRGNDTSYVGEGLGPPLGAVPFARFQEETIELRSDDTAVFYTDGLVEDRITTLDAGLERMREAVLAGADEINALADSIVGSCLGDRKIEDDVAVLVLRSVSLGAKLELHLPAEPRVLASFRQTMRRWLYEHEVTETDTQDVLLACGEACNNAIEHGSSPMNGWFDVEATMDGNLEFAIRSPGTWRAPRADGGGRGLPVMQALMDSVDIERGPEGIIVRMKKKLDKAKVHA